jgi:RimK family alpha-L-glutamate ligase
MLLYSKGHLTAQLNNIRLPHPKTLVTENIEKAHGFALDLLESGKTVVLKPLCRGRGIGVVRLDRIRSRSDLLQYLAWYNRSFGQGVFYLQEFIPNLGYDIRCMVVDGEVVGREKRSNDRDFRYNISAGGIAEPFDDPIYDELSIQVADAVGLKITGIDILPTPNGEYYVIEANCYPGYKALIDATGIPIHSKIVDYFEMILKK